MQVTGVGTAIWLQWVLLGGCAAGCLALAAGVFQLLRPGGGGAFFSLAVGTLLLFGAGLFVLSRSNDSSLGMFDSLLALSPAVVAGGIAARLKRLSVSVGGRGSAVALLASGVLTVALFGLRLEQQNEARIGPLSLRDCDIANI